jgi:8-oxo-dGTP pyrophosphatase MutT (NUDIX family)
MSGRWHTHAETALYDSPWVSLRLADVDPPSGQRHPHHLLRMPRHGAGAVVVDRTDAVLLVYRHRFIPDTFGWELPAGRIDPGETPEQAAAREVHEETGWTIQGVRRLCSIHTSPGLTDQLSHVLSAQAGIRTGDPDPDEAAELRWWPRADLPTLLRSGQITDAFTSTGLLWHLHLDGRSLPA